jgi:transcriptional repressor NrdR
MQCPFCGSDDTQVKDSRPSEDNSAIRRRRACPACGARFTTFERVQLREMTVIKSDKRRQPFDRDKMIRSLQVALRKRPVELEAIEKAGNEIVRELESGGDPEVSTTRIGECVMKALARLDAVAYIRFASVYHEFGEPEDFAALLRDLKAHQAREAEE